MWSTAYEQLRNFDLQIHSPRPAFCGGKCIEEWEIGIQEGRMVKVPTKPSNWIEFDSILYAELSELVCPKPCQRTLTEPEFIV